MLGCNTEFIWMSTLENQSMSLTKGQPGPKYRRFSCVRIQSNFSAVLYKHVK